ncbi:hypothetical protein [Rheinheimera pacifica]|uniref:hypothetical protein n=1 Tax=Rheinheimera pacifica TaxID=173990 RepID=UPI002ED79861
MIKAIFRLVTLCVLLTFFPVKADISQYSVFSDAAGNIYLKAPETFVLIHSDVSIPLYVLPANGLLKLSMVAGAWQITVMNQAQWRALQLYSGSSLVRRIDMVDFDGDGVTDIKVYLTNPLQPYIIVANMNNIARILLPSASDTPVVVEYEYDALGRLRIKDDSLNGKQTYDFDAAGNRKKVNGGN